MTSSLQTFAVVCICLGSHLIGSPSNASELTCGPKTVTVENGKLQEIKHEDGTVHTGLSVSRNWDFDGKSIKHRLFDDSIPCRNGPPPDRKTTVRNLSARFTEDPRLYGLNKREAKMMRNYTELLMTNDEECHLLIDGAKSTQRSGMFYVDCNDRDGKPHRFWISSADLKSQELRSPAKPIGRTAALRLCDAELKSRAASPAAYDSSLIFGSSAWKVPETGRNVVMINFSVQDSVGAKQKFRGKCIIESGIPIEVTAAKR